MTTDLTTEQIEFVENPEPRCPVILLLDISASMRGEKLQQLHHGLIDFSLDIKKDTLASIRCEIAIITFNSNVELAQDFVTTDKFSPRTFTASGTTKMAEGILFALEKMEERKQQYKENGINYYRPWLFMVTDGHPSDAQAVIADAGRQLRQAETENRLAVFCVGVQNANLNKLSQISGRAPVKMREMKFRDMFVWLSQSMSRVSRSRPDEAIALDTDALRDWAYV